MLPRTGNLPLDGKGLAGTIFPHLPQEARSVSNRPMRPSEAIGFLESSSKSNRSEPPQLAQLTGSSHSAFSLRSRTSMPIPRACVLGESIWRPSFLRCRPSPRLERAGPGRATRRGGSTSRHAPSADHLQGHGSALSWRPLHCWRDALLHESPRLAQRRAVSSGAALASLYR